MALPANKKYKHSKDGAKNTLAREMAVMAVIIFIAVLNVLFFFPSASKSIFLVSKDAGLKGLEKYGNSFEVFPQSPISCQTGDYLVFTIKAVNDASVDFPKGSVSLFWRFKGDYNYHEVNVEKFEIYIDSLPHEYHVRVGENSRWTIDEKITSFLVRLPNVKGVSIEVEKIEFKKRLILPVDSYLNRFFKTRFADIYRVYDIDRFLMPAYLGLVSSALMIFSFKLLSSKVNMLKALFFIFLSVMLIFSFYFMKNSFFTVKSYFSSYKSQIKSADLKNTYKGFYDFEKFIDWLDIKIPEDENIILLVRGDQVYIMSEMAYNLYPRDVKFINISLKNNLEVAAEIEKILIEKGASYSNIVALSKEDFEPEGFASLAHSYKPDAGLIFQFKRSLK